MIVALLVIAAFVLGEKGGFRAFFNTPFFQGTLGNLIATFLGIVLGLWATELAAERQREQARSETLQLLCASARKNLSRIAEFQRGDDMKLVEPFMYRTVVPGLLPHIREGELRRTIVAYGDCVEQVLVLQRLLLDLQYGLGAVMTNTDKDGCKAEIERLRVEIEMHVQSLESLEARRTK